MIEVSVIGKTKKMIGFALTVIGLSVFFISHSQGLIGQKVYSNLGCTVTKYEMPKSCAIVNDQMTGGFIGMIFSFFTTLFRASLIVPPILMKLIKKVKR